MSIKHTETNHTKSSKIPKDTEPEKDRRDLVNEINDIPTSEKYDKVSPITPGLT